MQRKEISVILLISLLIHWCESALPATEERLLNHLMLNHNKLVRPVLDIRKPINVTFGIELNQLIKIDDRSQLLVTKLWVRQSWHNNLLKWNASKWEGIDSVMVGPGDVWTPDIVLYDSAEPGVAGGPGTYKTQIALNADGSNRWLSPAVFTSTCQLNIKYFPFDRQVCSMQFGSWAYDAGKINLLKDDSPVITSKYVPSAEWEITKVEKVRNVLKYECCPNPYVDVTFELHLRRKPSFYVFNAIVPCLVLALTILFGFFFPPQSGERIGLIITILLAMAVFMQIISDTLPVNSDETPKLSLFYMVILIECAASLATTCAVLVMHYKGEEMGARPLPKWARKLFIDILATRLGLMEEKSKEIMENDASAYGNVNLVFPEPGIANGDASTHHIYDNANNHIKRGKTSRKVKRFQKSPNMPALKQIQKDVREVVSDMRGSQITKEISREWKVLGKVFDYIFFVLFLMTLIISAIAILVPAYLNE